MNIICESAHTLSALKVRIAALSRGRTERSHDPLTLDHGPLDAWLDGGLKRAQLHEIFAGDAEDAGSATGFASILGLLAQEKGKSLLWLRTRSAERRSGCFHGTGFAELGGNPASVVLGIVPDTLLLLRGAADALRCSGLGAVIVECWDASPELSLTTSRRLTLAAGQSGVTALMLRLGASPVPSTADTRWSVRAAPSRPLEARAPGHPAFDIALLRRRGGPDGQSWRVEWDRDRRRFRESALSGAVVPVPVGRPVQHRDTRVLARTG